MPDGQDNPAPEVQQDIHAARDSLTAGRDLTVNYYTAGTGQQERASERRPVVAGDIPQQPPGFQSRSDLLAELDAAGPGVSVVHAVTGMRGVGKTQLAAAYARAKLGEMWRLVAWVNAEDRGNLLAGLAAVAEAAGLAGAGAGQSTGDAGNMVRHWLEANGERRLLVFDNATDADALRPYVPAGGAARVLITSNRQSVANLGTKVGVEVFTSGEALAFLADRAGLADAAGAETVAAELGYLPLALAQAAAVIAGQRLTYGTYLERLRSLPVADYLTREPGQPYPHGVAEAVLLSLDAVQADDQEGLCTGILAIMSVLSAAGVRRDLMYAAGHAGVVAPQQGARIGTDAVDRALGQLAERSLLSFSLDGQVVIVHRLVQRVIREQLARQERLVAVCQAAASVLDTRAKALADSPDRPAVRDIPEQVTAWNDVVAGLPAESGAGLAGVMLGLRARALNHLIALGDSAQQAIVIGEPLIADQERTLGPNHPDTLASRNELAKAYWVTGRTGQAITLHERTLSARAQVLGPDHPDTLSSANNLAITYAIAGRTDEAIALFEQTLAARERVLGIDHHDTVGSRNNLAMAYRVAGRADEAIALLKRALAAFERVRGPDHPNTMIARNNLGINYQEAGRTDEAIAFHERNLADRERVLGPDHPDTLQSQNNLALAYRDAGRTDEAIALHQRATAAFERMRGPDHPDTLETRDGLAEAYQAAGRMEEAIALHERNVADRERVLGPDHPDTVTSRNNLTRARSNRGE